MKLNEYISSMKQIKVSQKKKEEIWNELIQKESIIKQPFFKKTIFRFAMGAGIAFLLLFMLNQLPVLAEHNSRTLLQQVQELFQGFLGKEDNDMINQDMYNITGAVVDNVYYDENEHVRMEVLEQLSDGITVLLTIRYTALDEAGMQWLSNNTENEFLQQNFRIAPVIQDNDTISHGVNWIPDIKCLSELNKGCEWYFYVGMRADSLDYQTGKILFRYRMPEGEELQVPVPREIELEAESENLDFVAYKIAGQDDNSVCEVQYLYVSGLSFMVYGKKGGDWNNLPQEERWSSFTLIYEEEEEEVRLTAGDFGISDSAPKEENQYSDLIISGSFYKVEAHETEEGAALRTFDPDLIEQLVYYDAKGEHICQLIKEE